MATLDPTATFGDLNQNTGLAGEDISCGQVVYVRQSDGAILLARSDQTYEKSVVAGVAANNAVAGQPIKYLTNGLIALGATPYSAGILFCLSDIPGEILAVTDTFPADVDPATYYLTIVGWSEDDNYMRIHIGASGQKINGNTGP